jgi:ubiquinone/menaquinone biosynthesis C-methylase UbiE
VKQGKGEKMKTDFDTFAEDYDLWARTTRDRHHYEEWQRLLPPHNRRVLDAGCGSGLLALFLADHADCVVGMDISAKMVSLARKRRLEQRKGNVHFVTADLDNLPLQEETFDLVVSDTALRHTQLHIALPGLRSMVRPNGRMVLRDLVTNRPKFAVLPIWHVLRAFRMAPAYIRRHGFRTTNRNLAFRLSPSWIRHECSGAWFTPDSFQTIYSRFLPGCWFKDYGWAMAAIWEPRFAAEADNLQ